MSQGVLEVLADFFDTIGSQKAHWYRVFDAENGDAKDLLLSSTFPSLASLMKMERRFVQELFLEVGLLKTRLYRGTYIVHADRKNWDSFINQNCLLMETTVFEPRNTKNLYIKVGGWNSSHLPVTPGKIWKDAVKLGFYNVPKLRISSAAMKLARNIGKQFTTRCLSVSSIDKGSDDSTSTSENVEDEIQSSSTNTTVDDLPDAMEYPLFHSHGLKICDDTIRNRAVHELLKYNGGHAIHYRQMSHHKGALIRIPSATSAKGYAGMLRRKENFMKDVIKFMGDCLNDSNGNSDAVKCILQFCFDNFEDEFKEIAKNNSVLLTDGEKKMEPSKVEAMLHESKIGKANSRVLFRHLNQFLGKSLFASEKRRKQCFAGQEFNPTTAVYELPDKTKVHYWYKLPDEMLKHQAKFIFTEEDLCGVSGVDITVGGDHGKGK
jgi:hypothetical protein